jgi:hypothetical protein
VWYHDGCAIDGDSCLREEKSTSDTYFLLAMRDEFLCEDWETRLKKIKVTNKWSKLKFACRFQIGLEQILRSCSVDAPTVAISLLRELSRPGLDLFVATDKFAKIPRRGSWAQASFMQTMALRNDFARLVVGALITFRASTDNVWIGIIDAWRHIKDGIPDFADWDAAEVLVVLAACKGLSEEEIQECMKASYPADIAINLGQDMLDEQESIEKEVTSRCLNSVMAVFG